MNERKKILSPSTHTLIYQRTKKDACPKFKVMHCPNETDIYSNVGLLRTTE